MSEEHLVRVKDCARILGMSTRSLYSLAKTGKVPSYSAGGKLRGVRVSISEVRAALKRPILEKEAVYEGSGILEAASGCSLAKQ